MMPLQEQLSEGEWLDYERFEFLKGIGDQIFRMDECHPNDFCDDYYIFNIWLKSEATPEKFLKSLKENISKIQAENPKYPPPWRYEVHPTGFEFISVWTYL